ncbi:unnamed protein product [Thlaspi arvense]|uniref:Uncharacterized protein n=1 Tax=Thlaspi arvense TaxID=13288 RepID=A0AAU9RQR0_THLAR|nr:unnamed protein product [Thlaspi arvense]
MRESVDGKRENICENENSCLSPASFYGDRQSLSGAFRTSEKTLAKNLIKKLGMVLCIVGGTEERTESTENCITEEVKPGKFVKKCVKTKKITSRSRNSSSVKVVHFSTENTEEDVTGPVMEWNEKQVQTEERAVCRLM